MLVFILLSSIINKQNQFAQETKSPIITNAKFTLIYKKMFPPCEIW